MQVGPDKVVAISYDLKVSKGTSEKIPIENIDNDHAFQFLYGNSGLPHGFEEKLKDLEENDSFHFTLNTSEAYGEYSEEAIITVPKQAFEINGKIEEGVLTAGNFIPMTDDRGFQVQGKVMEVSEKGVKMDFNHPLVGMDLHFEGKVEKIREATKEEIAHGHVH